ncbi:DUF1566 domain-containing protein, partial [Sulfurovum sp.]|uniref:Lcl C-terminal domain-containing protein n=1 Tax=Sulfurovum sp. TaxID=1969726 RepID=UPI0025CBF588
MKQILLITLAFNTLLLADFTKNGNTVTDSATGLQWQDDTVGYQMQWKAAIAHCEALSLDGHNDWRLPNAHELNSIVDKRRYAPSIDPVFEHTASGGYWS